MWWEVVVYWLGCLGRDVGGEILAVQAGRDVKSFDLEEGWERVIGIRLF